MNNSVVKTVTIVTSINGSVTINPVYKNSVLTVTEVAPDSNQKNPSYHESWWDIRPCKYCKKMFSKHQEYTKGCGPVEGTNNMYWATNYEPMDALSFIEHLAKEKGLL